MLVWDGSSSVNFGEEVTAVEVQEGMFINTGFTSSNGGFVAPAATEEEQQQTEQQLITSNLGLNKNMIEEAVLRISFLQGAVDLDMATSEEVEALTEWEKFRALLSRSDANTPDKIEWPIMP